MANSVVTTGGVTLTAATIEPVVAWVMKGAPQPIPENVPFLIAAGLITLAHALYRFAVIKGLIPTDTKQESLQ